ncbi:MAG: SMC-Scp complex subunit ScpB [Clostridia bacterium]|nr:SMC-Scp complex subunit ScpB [Clostridia bacterium]
MEIELLDNILEALLLVSGNALNVRELTEQLELQKSEMDGAIKRLKKKYGGQCGIQLLTYNGKIQFGSNPAYDDVVSGVLNPIKEKELSSAALETVAIIAYKQPVTRLEVEQIRGVNCDYAIQVLLKHNLIEVTGRKDVIGKPLLFGTTDSFLKRFQIEDISQLPDYDKLLESIRVIEGTGPAEEQSLYNEFEIPDEPLPEFLEGEENLQKVE